MTVKRISRRWLLVPGVLAMATAIAATGSKPNTAPARGASMPKMLASKVNNADMNVRAGFPANAANVNQASNGKMTWMMSRTESRQYAVNHARAQADARKQIVRTLADGKANVTSELFGTADESTYMVSGVEFQGGLTDALLARDPGGGLTCRVTGLATDYFAQVRLPAGALVTGMTVYGVDSSLIDDVDATLNQVCYGGTNNGSGTAPEVHVTTGFAGGAYAATSQASNLTVDNADCVYLVRVDSSDALLCDGLNTLNAVAIRWKRQISPDPIPSTFTDVPAGAQFHREIEALASSGITSGCGNNKYCPGDPVTRGQMAAFLSRALGLHWQSY